MNDSHIAQVRLETQHGGSTQAKQIIAQGRVNGKPLL